MSREAEEKREKPDSQRTAGHDGALFTRAASELLKTLPERSRAMLDARFGVSAGEARTLAYIGQKERISRERVRQIVEAGLAQLARASSAGDTVARAQAVIRDHAHRSGGVLTEHGLLTSVGAPASSGGALRLLLASMPDVTEARETQRTTEHWVIRPAQDAEKGPTLESVLEAAEHLLGEARHVMPVDAFLARLRAATGGGLPESALRTYLSVSKYIVHTPLGTYGLRTWREAVPRSVGDKAYVVMQQEKKPMHFRDVAEAINRIGFDRKKALPETVHNDLIRDARFVLVGRGLYALKEWGFAPGRVADVVERVLRVAQRPMTRADIIAAVLKERFVKRNTILLSLLNHEHVEVLPDGTFALKAGGGRATHNREDLSRGSSRPNTNSPVS